MKLENLQIRIKDGEVMTLQGLDTVTAERLEDILNYVAATGMSRRDFKVSSCSSRQII